MTRRLQDYSFFLAIWLVLLVVIPVRPVGASPPIKLWSNGKPRQVGPVEITGIPGRDYYRQAGEWTYWYRNGQMRKKGSFSEGTESGWWKYWYDNGVRRKEGAFNDRGEKVGPWRYWYENGMEDEEGTYKDGLPDGHWVFNYNQVENSLQKEGDFIKGREDGFWVYRYSNGRNKKEGSYIKGMEEGPWKYWYEEGELKSEGSYSNGLEMGGWVYWDRTGGGEDRKVNEWSYIYTETSPSKKPREVGSPSQALKGHWLSEKALANFTRSLTEPEDLHHLYLGSEDKFLEVVGGGFLEGTYIIEKEDPAKRTIQFRITRPNGKGAVLFAIFSEDYCKLAGMYYLVDFLRGSRGRTTNYFLMDYAGTDPGPEL
jgi:antitoxin component YwqK of YwqJK toxin-antitoxin module